ncbi:disease resistance protein At4g27190-like [Arachis stenosperma]|uniref:disease resistance protein At4g27190-like n=1 Tax=Arachis stenosperma TaxID=217475 RepID=UPI0025AC6F6D|nr:disease resistance protein At4g27190-like [Arachis stenosperma]
MLSKNWLSKTREDEKNGHEILPHVENWLQMVDELEGDLGRFKEDETNRNKKCHGGWCPNLKTRYSFSKNAKKNAAKLVQLNEQKHEAISISTPPLKFAELLATKGIKSFESRNEIVRAVIEKLKEEGSEKLFHKIATVTVSQNVNYTNVQAEIASRLDLTFADKDPMLERAQNLLNRINKIPGVLIVLDDVWTGLDLDSNGNEDIAKQCGGLPIAIMTVGKTLRGKRDKYVWESALKDLRTSSASFSKVEKCIELRYTLLDKRNAKDLLFWCCSFPEDTDIPIKALLREGWGLGTLFQDKYFIV